MPVTSQHHYTRWLYFMFVAIFVFCACKKEGPRGDPGPQGPQGPQGPAGNPNVKTGTVAPASAEWLWGGFWALTTSTGSSTIYTTRYVDINTNLVTADIVANGTVLVHFKPENNGWVPLPFRFLDVTRNYYFNIVYEYFAGKIRLHYFWDSNTTGGGTPTGLNSHVIPTYTFKYMIIAGSAARKMNTGQ